MAFKLNKGEENQFEKLKRSLWDTYSELGASIEEYNNREQELRADVNNALTLYNGALAELRAFVEEVASDRLWVQMVGRGTRPITCRSSPSKLQ